MKRNSHEEWRYRGLHADTKLGSSTLQPTCAHVEFPGPVIMLYALDAHIAASLRQPRDPNRREQ